MHARMQLVEMLPEYVPRLKGQHTVTLHAPYEFEVTWCKGYRRSAEPLPGVREAGAQHKDPAFHDACKPYALWRARAAG